MQQYSSINTGSKRAASLLRLALLGVMTIALAYVFGDSGLEAFITVYVLTGITLSLYMWQLGALVMKTEAWLVFRFIGLAIIASCWLAFLAVIIVPIVNPTFHTVLPQNVNWLIVIVATLAYLISHVVTLPRNLSLKRLSINTVSSLFSIALMYFGLIVFDGHETFLQGIVLVVVVQLQFVMNYIFISTDYVEMVHIKTTKWLRAHRIVDFDVRAFILATILGLPFLLSLAVLVIIASL